MLMELEQVCSQKTGLKGRPGGQPEFNLILAWLASTPKLRKIMARAFFVDCFSSTSLYKHVRIGETVLQGAARR